MEHSVEGNGSFFQTFPIKCYIAVMVSISLWEWYKEWSSLYLRVTCWWQWTPVFMMRRHGVWCSPGKSPGTAKSHDWSNSNCSYLQKTINCSLNLFCSLCVKIMLWFDQKQNTKAIFATLRDCSGHWLDECSSLWSQLNSNDVQGRQLKSNSGWRKVCDRLIFFITKIISYLSGSQLQGNHSHSKRHTPLTTEAPHSLPGGEIIWTMHTEPSQQGQFLTPAEISDCLVRFNVLDTVEMDLIWL